MKNRILKSGLLILLFTLGGLTELQALTILTNQILTNQGAGGGWTFDETCDVVRWTDRQGRQREAWIVQARGNGDASMNGGFITRIRWDNGTVTKDLRGGVYGWEDDLNGFGGTVNHDNTAGGYYMTFKQMGDQVSPFSGFVSKGDHHAVWRLRGKHYYSTARTGNYIWTTVEYVFKDGEDQFQYVITHDCTPSPGNWVEDCRSPYCQFDWDGDGTETNRISGMGYGSAKKWITTDLANYDYTQDNLIPYVWEWNQRPGFDDEIGYVQSRLHSKHKGGMTNALIGTAGPITTGSWDYQMNLYSYPNIGKGNRLTWGSPDHAIDGGGRQIGTVPNTEQYSLSIMIDRRTTGGVQRIVTENEIIHNAGTVLSATKGSVATTGIASAGLTNIITYDKAGFDQVYRNWKMVALNAGAAGTLALSSGSLANPTFCIENYTAAAKPTNVSKNGVKLAENTGYYCSLDTAKKTLLVTFLSDFTGSSTFSIQGAFDASMPGMATGISATTVAAGTNRIMWTDEGVVTGETYSVYRSSSQITAFGGLTPIATGIAAGIQQYRDTLNANGTFYYAVKSTSSFGVVNTNIVAGGNATTSGLVSVDITPPPVPTGLSIISNGMHLKLALNWTAVGASDLAGYNIYRGTTSGSEVFIGSVGLVTSYTDMALTDGQRYYYRIASYDNKGTPNVSAQSVEVSAVAKALANSTTVYNDTINLLTFGWWDSAPNGTYQGDTTLYPPIQEGTRHNALGYNITGWWQAITYNIAPAVDMSAAGGTLQFAYKGPSAGNMYLVLGSANAIANFSEAVGPFPVKANYFVTNIPMSLFQKRVAPNDQFNNAAVSVLYIQFSGVDTANGVTFAFDNVVFKLPVVASGIIVTNRVATPAVVTNSSSRVVVFTAKAKSLSGSITNVSLNLSSVGGPASVKMTNISGMTSFRYSYLVTAGQAAGTKTIPVIARNSLGSIENSKSIQFNVVLPPSGIVVTNISTSPATISNSASVPITLTLKAKDVLGGSITNVTVNLSSIGGSATAKMANIAGMTMFQYNYNVPAGYPPSAVSLPIQVWDNSGNVENTHNFSLNIMSTTPASNLSVTAGTLNGRPVWNIKWYDQNGKRRTAALVQNGSVYSGVIQDLTYYNGSTLVHVFPDDPNTSPYNAGFGSTVHHGSSAQKLAGNITKRYQGSHLVIFDFVQTIDGVIEHVTYTFMNGLDYFQWATTADTRNGNVAGDARGPYCTMNWDGIAGLTTAEGTRYAANGYFVMDNITSGAANYLGGNWTLTGKISPSMPNGAVDIPFAWEWDNGCEVGYVQSQTYQQQLAGDPTWSCSANMPASGTFLDGNYNWAADFQMNFYDGAKKIVWGMPYGYMNHSNPNSDYNGKNYDGGTKNQWGQYSLSIIFDGHAQGGVMRVRNENRIIQSNQVSVSATIGSLMTTGPVGTKNTNNLQTLVPAGYDHNYRTWWIRTTNQSARILMNFQAGKSFVNPTFRLRGLNSVPLSLTLNGVPLTLDTDYFASIVSGTPNEVWLTFNRTLSGNNTINIGGGPTAKLGLFNASIAPATVTNGKVNLIVVQCKANCTNGTLTGVSADFSSVGGAVLPMTNIGSSNFRCSFSVPAGVTAGSKTITITATESGGTTKQISPSLMVLQLTSHIWSRNLLLVPSIISNTKANDVRISLVAGDSNGSVTGVYLGLSSVGGPTVVSMSNKSGFTNWAYTYNVAMGQMVRTNTLPLAIVDNAGLTNRVEVKLVVVGVKRTIWARHISIQPAIITNHHSNNITMSLSAGESNGSLSGVYADLVSIGGGASVAMTVASTTNWTLNFNAAAGIAAGTNVVRFRPVDTFGITNVFTGTIVVREPKRTIWVRSLNISPSIISNSKANSVTVSLFAGETNGNLTNVYLNLIPVGGSSRVAMNQVGFTNWSYTWTVPAGRPVSTNNLTLTCVDFMGKTNQYSVQLVIRAPFKRDISLNSFQISPNPLVLSGGEQNGSYATIYYEAEDGDKVAFEVYTILGDFVIALEGNPGKAVVWDGKNDKGRNIASGMYLVFMKVNGKLIKTSVKFGLVR